MNRAVNLKMVSLTLALLLLTALLPERALSEESFFKGKTIRIVVGFPPGGGFDTFSRVLARHLPRYIPGKPSTIVQNMPGGASMAAANRVYAMQPGDGLTMVAMIYGAAFQYFTGDPKVKFDPTKYIWLGEPTVGSVPTTLFVRTDLNIRNLEDLKKRKKPIFLGGSARSSLAGIGSHYLESIGLPVKPVLGYAGSAPVFAAIERKEVDGRISSQETGDGDLVRRHPEAAEPPRQRLQGARDALVQVIADSLSKHGLVPRFVLAHVKSRSRVTDPAPASQSRLTQLRRRPWRR